MKADGTQAPPTQGFFGKPVDNLHAEPLIARWIRTHVTGWQEAVVVSKNPGGTKRVTSLADALKLNFGLVTTDRRRTNVRGSLEGSAFFDRIPVRGQGLGQDNHEEEVSDLSNGSRSGEQGTQYDTPPRMTGSTPHINNYRDLHNITSNRLTQPARLNSTFPSTAIATNPQIPPSHPSSRTSPQDPDPTDEYTDERARDVITGTLRQGRIIDDDDAFSSPILSTMSTSLHTLPGIDSGNLGDASLQDHDPMTLYFLSSTSRVGTAHENALGGSIIDATAHSDDEEEGFKDPELEHTVTLVGNVRDKVVFIIDDMIDQAGSWIAAAETVVKRGEAKQVYCIATHGLFGERSLEMMEECECIDFIVVTNTYPIAEDRHKRSRKLVVLDVSGLLGEAIRRNHYGESISPLLMPGVD